MKREKICILPKLHDYKGDLTKKWFVYYSYRDAMTGKMIRFRIYNGFSTCPTAEERIENARKAILQITRKLKRGWNPIEDTKEVIYEDHVKYSKLAESQGRIRQSRKNFNYFASEFLKERKPNISPATYTTYKSKLRIFNLWLGIKKWENNDVSFFEATHAHQFIDYLFNTRKCGNNMVRQYLLLMNMFFTWVNKLHTMDWKAFADIKVTRVPAIPAKYFNDSLLDKLKKVISEDDPQLWLAALFQYYCFIRPKEMRFLKVGHINFQDGSVTVPGDIAKNNKTQTVVVPEVFLLYLKNLGIDKLPGEYHLITPERVPGLNPVSKNYLWSRFKHYRMQLGLPQDYKFYSFKHTGAVKASKYIPVKDLQMQLRHHSLDQVDAYLRQMKAVESESLRNLFPSL